MNVESLKKMGYDVDIVHERFKDYGGLWGDKPFLRAKGGRTTAVITDRQRKLIVSGTALCSPEDNYNKKVGAKVAIARAIVQIPELRDKVPNLFL